MSEDTLPQSALHIDKPIEHQKDDLYDRGTYVQNLAKALQVPISNEGLIIGIDGPWGSGKTSLKNLLIEQLKSSDPSKTIPVVEFDPWIYSGSGKLVSLMFKEISLALSGKTGKYKHWFAKISKKAESYASDIAAISNNTFQRSGAYVEATATLFKNVGEALEPDGHDIDKLSERLVKLRKKLDESPTRIIVFIDDLDRLMDDEVVDILRAVKAVGDLPHVTYVLLYDRGVITKALDKSCHGKGVEYLEKVIQVPVGLPKPPDEAVQDKLKKELDKVIGENAHEIYDFPLEYLPYSERWVYKSCVIPFIHNMRDVIRLANEFGLRYQVLQDDVEPGDLLAITVLEVFRPHLHRWIMGNKDLLCSPSEGEISSNQDDVNRRAEKLRVQLESLLSENQETAELKGKDRTAVESLFPLAFYGEEGIVLRKGYREEYRDIANPAHFDAYFRLSIDQDLLHESQFKQFLIWDSLDEHNLNEDHWKILTDYLFPSKAERYLSEYNTVRAAKIVGFCLDLESQFGPTYQSCPSLKTAVSIMNASAKKRESVEYMDEVLRAIIESGTALSMPVAASLAADIQSDIQEDIQEDEDNEPLFSLMEDNEPLFSLMNAFRYPRLDIDHKNEETHKCEKRWLQKLRNHLKSSQGKKRGKLPSAEFIRIYANVIPYLYETEDGETNEDEYLAFATFQQLIPEDQSPIYVADALIQQTGVSYVMNLPLLRRLIEPEAYQSAFEAWIANYDSRDAIPCDPYSLMAYETTIDNQNAPDTISEQAVKDAWDKRKTNK